ncbi:MAG: antitoxin family protein [Chloroflexi bacterium]|nr:antitoxin family protein [Chloroflexota bacterium]
MVDEMVQTVTAKYEDGFLKPTTALDLDEGDVVVVTISGRRITTKDVEASRSSAGAWRGRVDAENLIAGLYEARIQGSAHMVDDDAE